jgi:hypothetical protein
MRLTELFQGCVAAKPRACTLDISTKNVQFQEADFGTCFMKNPVFPG